MAVRLGVVVPVRLLDEAGAEQLSSMARAAPALQFVAVGEVAATPRAAPANLCIVAARCGLYEAMNRGLSESEAEHLLFMGMDDRLIDANVAQALAELPRAPLIAMPYVYGGKAYRLKPAAARPRAFHHQGVLFERAAALGLGGYAPGYALHADLDLMFRMQREAPAAWMDVPLVEFRAGGITTTGERSLESMREIDRIYQVHGVSRLDRMYFFSVVNLSWFWLRRRLGG